MLRVRNPVYSAPDSAFQWCIEVPPPGSMRVGGGSAVHLAGWCFHRETPILDLRFDGAGHVTPALAHSLPRPDVRAALYPGRDPNDNSYASGFFAVLPLPGIDAVEDVGVFIQVDLEDGRTERHLVDLIRTWPAPDIAPAALGASDSITICMATHDPPYELFARQIESIVQQTCDEWRCIISDDRSQPHLFDRMRHLLAGDDRFVIDRSQLRLGAYYNFERALTLVSRDTRHVALADQDDRWYPEKLEKLRAAFHKPDITLAYSDCRITDPGGAVLSDTFFARRHNNSTDLRKMLLANTVAGASSMFRRDLLDHALPLPPVVDPRVSFHDHWLALVALALGQLHYVGAPLWDYVQHDENVVGHAVMMMDENSYKGPWLLRSQATYQSKLIRTALLATALEQRLRGQISRGTDRELRQLSALERSPIGLAKLVAHAAGSSRSRSPTEGVERDLLSAIAWRRRMSRAARKRDRLAHPWYSAASEITTGAALAEDLPAVRALATVTAPLSLQVSEDQQPRVNLMMGRLELENILDNDLGKLALAAGLGAMGLTVRIIAFGDELFPPAQAVLGRMQSLSGPPSAELAVEIVSSRDALSVSPADTFVATDWLTAYAAHLATTQLGRKRFLYVIDEFAGEDAGTDAPTESSNSYRLPHCALFWSERVEAYFRSHRVGVFSSDFDDEAAYASLVPAIAAVDPPDAAELTARRPSRLLFHAPGSRDQPDMFAVGVLALARAAESGQLSGWEVNAIGTSLRSAIRLAPSVELLAVDPIPPEAYPDFLRAHDVGISLTPTFRLAAVATEMAASGLPTVTVGVDRDDQRWLETRSNNFLPVQPTAEGLAQGLLTAVPRASDFEQRIRGSALDQPRSWRETFGPASMERICSLLKRCGEA